ncbi:MAG: hypothetical protein R3Y43_05280 [Alphaproteobacteria bacterium]
MNKRKIITGGAIGLTFLLNAGIALATDSCAISTSCEDLGYLMNETNCSGFVSIKCPFDKTKLFCDTTVPCDINTIYNTDGTCSKTYLSGKTPKGIIVSKSSTAYYLWPLTRTYSSITCSWKGRYSSSDSCTSVISSCSAQGYSTVSSAAIGTSINYNAVNSLLSDISTNGGIVTTSVKLGDYLGYEPIRVLTIASSSSSYDYDKGSFIKTTTKTGYPLCFVYIERKEVGEICSNGYYLEGGACVQCEDYSYYNFYAPNTCTIKGCDVRYGKTYNSTNGTCE